MKFLMVLWGERPGGSLTGSTVRSCRPQARGRRL